MAERIQFALILQSQKTRDLIELQKEVNIEMSNQKGIWECELPKDDLELSFYANGEIKDFEVLKSLLSLFEELLNGLRQINSIKKPTTNSRLA